MVPIGPRSEAQLHRSHKSVMNPSTSKRLGDVLVDIEKWEGRLREYYHQCGGSTIPEGTKVPIAMGILPASTNAGIRLPLNGINDFAQFKDTLRDSI